MNTSNSKMGELKKGWFIIAAAMIGCGAGASSLPFYSFGLFMQSMQRDFGWTRADITAALLFKSLALAALAPVIGWVIDRYSPRKVVLTSVILFSAILLGLSQMNGTLFQFYFLYSILMVLGGGTTPILYTRVVSRNFDVARGTALGLTLAGIGIAAIIIPPTITPIIETYGWRWGYGVMAVVALMVWPVLFFGLRVKTSTDQATIQAKKKGGEIGLTLPMALTTVSYWMLLAGFFLVSLAISSMMIHMVPMLRDSGMTAVQAAGIASLIGVGVVVGRIVIGWLVDQFFAGYVAGGMFLLTGIGAAILIWGGANFAQIAAFLVGLSLGAEVDLIAYFVSRYCGLKHYGKLYAVVYAMFIVGNSIGPFVAGKIFDATKTYSVVLWVNIGLLIASAIVMFLLPRFPSEEQISEKEQALAAAGAGAK